MIVIANHTEYRLAKELKGWSKTDPARRCFYLRFSKANVPKRQLFEAFLRLLDELPNAYLAQVYICKDQDVFLMMQGLTQKGFESFLKRLSGELGADDFLKISEVFEIGMHWRKVEAICEDKIDLIELEQKEQSEQKEKEKASVTTKKVLEKLETHLLAELQQKRDQREDPIIMTVDDDFLSRTLVCSVLEKEYRMVFAKNGAEAIHEYVMSAPDVLFLDIGLPDINGHELLEVLTQIDPDGYIIMFSGRKGKSNMLKALRLGSQGFVGKPFSHNKLTHYIEKSPHIQTKKMLLESKQKVST